MYGYFWNGDKWRLNNAIQFGLPAGKSWGSPTVFAIDTVFKLIIGVSDVGNYGFLGYTISEFDPMFTSNYDKGISSEEHLLNKIAID